MKKGRYVLCLLPGENVSNDVFRLRKALEGAFDKIPGSPPHITLKETFITTRIDQCAADLHEKYSFLNLLELSIKEHKIFENNYLVLKVKKNDILNQLHVVTVKTAQKFVEEVKPYVPSNDLTPNQQAYSEVFNNPFIFEHYNPHISIGRLKKGVNVGDITKVVESFNTDQIIKLNQAYVINKENHSRIIYASIPFVKRN